jgi:hypothetical protein
MGIGRAAGPWKKLRRTTMTRQLILTLAAAASVAAASVTLGSSAVYARGGMGGGGGGHFSSGARIHMAAVNHTSGLRSNRMVTRRARTTPITIAHLHHHHHHHWVFRGGRWIVLDGEDIAEAPVLAPAAVPGPCTCLTKTYTPEGLVVFADVCTKESASAPVEGDTADASQAPTSDAPAKATPMAQVPTKPNYAGRNYDDYLAANPQLQPQAAVPGAQKN